VPGRVDPEVGSVTLAVNLGWHDLALGPELAARFGVPVAVENDVRAAAAWLHARDAVDRSDLAYVAVGTGISAGVILDGRLHRGPRGLAGEIGHVVLEQGGPRCMCGLDGCLEALASGRGIATIATAAVEAGASSSLVGRGPVTAAAVYEAARDGDALALEVVNTAGAHLARAIHELVMAYDVPRVILGGGVARAGRLFLDPVTRGLDDLRSRSELAREALPSRLIELLPPDADPGCWGAVFLARTAAGQPAGTATDATGQEVLAS
jgi:glucokinase